MENRKEIRITADKSIFSLPLADIWAYRDLILLLVRRDFVANYKQTILGPVWLFIQPLFTTFMFTFLFAKIGGIKTDKIPSDLFYLCGIIFWNYFSSCLKTNSTTFISNQGVFGKVYFPRVVIPLSVTISNLIKLGIQFLLFLVYYAYFLLYKGADIHITNYIILLPLNVILLGLLGLGIGVLISSLTTKYRDLSYLVDFGLQLVMYATIIFPVSYFPDNLKWFAAINPLIPIIETSKLGLLGAGTFHMSSYLFCITITIVTLIVGTLIFNRTEQNFMDVV
jgi:lipopolysaccharide transport system permease protein